MPKRNSNIQQVAERLLSQCVVEGECWVRPNDSRRPYVTMSGRKRVAARVIAAAYHGLSIERGDLMVTHVCHNKRCLNPQHLSLGSHRDNASDEKMR